MKDNEINNKIHENIVTRTNKYLDHLFSIEIIQESSSDFILNQDCVGIIRINGLVEVELEQRKIKLTSNNVLLLKNGNIKNIKMLMEDSKIYAMRINEEALDDYLKSQMSDCQIFYDFLRLKAKKEEYLLFDLSFDPLVQVYLELLFYEASKIIEDGSHSTYEKSVRCALILFLTNLHKNHQQSLIISESTMMDDYDVGRILKYMAENYRTATLSSVAKHFNFHPAYFSSLFKKIAECSFSEKILQIRLEQARRLLATTDTSIQEIIELVGFTEKSYFYKVFKRQYKMTPLQYRKLLIKKKA